MFLEDKGKRRVGDNKGKMAINRGEEGLDWI